MPKYVVTRTTPKGSIYHLIQIGFKGRIYQFASQFKDPDDIHREALDILARLHNGTLDPDTLRGRHLRRITVQTSQGPLSKTRLEWPKFLGCSVEALYKQAKTHNISFEEAIQSRLPLYLKPK